MSDPSSNVSRGRAHEQYRMVNDNALANSALVLVVLAAAGLEGRRAARLRHAGCDRRGREQRAGPGAVRAEGAHRYRARGAHHDDTNNLVRLTYPDQTWASVVAGDSWAKLLTCTDYDTTTGTDTDVVPGSPRRTCS